MCFPTGDSPLYSSIQFRGTKIYSVSTKNNKLMSYKYAIYIMLQKFEQKL